MSQPKYNLARMKWLCRRGMKELDVLFEDFLQNHYPNANQDLQQGFIALLEMQDPEICDLLFRRKTHNDKKIQTIIDFFLKHSIGENEPSTNKHNLKH